jgi:prolyl-tRNA synthetase
MMPAGDGEDIILVCPKCKSAKTYPPQTDELAGGGARKAGKVGEKESCAECGSQADKLNTIEVGHIFKLGTKYSQTLGANFLDARGKLSPIIMGCYGIGVSRLISAVVEQNYDSDGIIWPNEISPYKVIILPLEVSDTKIMESATQIYNELQQAGIETILDDRDERAGSKFKDADLLGIQLQVILGRDAVKNNTLELKIRRNQEKIIKTKQEILSKILEYTHG